MLVKLILFNVLLESQVPLQCFTWIIGPSMYSGFSYFTVLFDTDDVLVQPVSSRLQLHTVYEEKMRKLDLLLLFSFIC